MKNFLKIITFLLSIILIISIFTGCKDTKESSVQAEDIKNSAKEQEAISEVEKQLPITIKIIAQTGGDDLIAEAYETVLEEFKNENSHITIEDESGIADEFWKAKIAADFVANNEADIIFTFTGSKIKNIIEQGKVVSIDEIKGQYPEYADNILKSALDSVKEYDGNTYAIPVVGFYEGLFVNKKIFEENNLELPTDWRKFQIAIETLDKKDILPVLVSLGHIPHYWIEWFENFNKEYDLATLSKGIDTVDNGFITQMFKNSELAMLIGDSKVIDGLAELESITILPLPTNPTGKINTDNAVSRFETGWYITRKAWDDIEKRDSVVKLVEKMISPEIIAEFIKPDRAPSVNADKIR